MLIHRAINNLTWFIILIHRRWWELIRTLRSFFLFLALRNLRISLRNSYCILGHVIVLDWSCPYAWLWCRIMTAFVQVYAIFMGFVSVKAFHVHLVCAEDVLWRGATISSHAVRVSFLVLLNELFDSWVNSW